MTVLLLKNYNNYFNRILKKEQTIESYKLASTSYLEYADVNFEMRDGIATVLIVGSEGQKDNGEILKFDDLGTPDYLVVHDNTNIKSRWFIIESVKIRGGQYQLALKRDVLSDFNSQVMNSPCFVEKGSINDLNDPLLLNSEGMSFNQQKQGEKLLRDNTYSAWLVGYLKKGMSEAKTITYTFPNTVSEAVALDSLGIGDAVTLYNLDGSTTSARLTPYQINNNKSSIKFRTQFQNESWPTYANGSLHTGISFDLQHIINDVDIWDFDWGKLDSNALLFKDGNQFHWIDKKAALELGNDIFTHTRDWTDITTLFNNLKTDAKYNFVQGNNLLEVENITKYNGMLVSKNNKIYRLTVGQGTPRTFTKYYTGEDTIANDYLSSLYFGKTVYNVEYFLTRNTANPTKNKVQVDLQGQEYYITATEIIVGQTLSFTLPVSSARNGCEDATYDMFCAPIDPSALGLNFNRSNTYVNTVGRVATMSEPTLTVCMNLATEEGAGTEAGWIYDLQVLPYCPLGKDFLNNVRVIKPNYLDEPSDVRMYLTGLTETKDYSFITDGNNNKRGIIFYPKKANFDTTINTILDNTHTEDREYQIDNITLQYFGHSDDTGMRPGDWPLYGVQFPYPVEEDIDMNTLEWSSAINYWMGSGLADILGVMAGANQKPYVYFVVYSKGEWTSTGIYDDISFGESSYLKLQGKWIIPDSTEDKKIQNETDFYRIASPNYNSFYEFKKTKLEGGVNGLRAICTYKPFSPFIKINPNLDGSLYSIKDYNDNIGLLLAGDYSLPMITDAMVNYELQNRNYQAIFNRSLQNLDVNQRIAKEQQQFQGIVGAITAPITGGLAGAATGAKAGPYGAIAGAVVGAAGGAALGVTGYLKDQEWLQQQQYEARDFAVDNFNYQLGNVQALPQTMTKSTPLSYNNKIWPILEHFSCTDKEKEVLKNKLKYDGMTVMAIGTLEEYSSPAGFLKGKMIRFNDLNDDSHIAQAIYEEVEKGFYQGE